MDKLPTEIILSILNNVDYDAQKLLSLQLVSPRFYRIIQDTAMWYKLFAAKYPVWGRHVSFRTAHRPFTHWKNYVLYIAKRNKKAQSLVFDILPTDKSNTTIQVASQIRKRKHRDDDFPVFLQDGPSWELFSTTKWVAISTDHTVPPSPSSSSMSSLPTYTVPPSPSSPVNACDLTCHGLSPGRARSDFQQVDEPEFHCSFTPLSSQMDEHDYLKIQAWDDTPVFTPFHFNGTTIVDVDAITNTGVIATSKHREVFVDGSRVRSENKILFWEYPSWRLICEYDMSVRWTYLACQLIGLQTVRIPSGSEDEKVRIFAVALGRGHANDEADQSAEDRVDEWETIFVHRLYDNGTTEFIATINLAGGFMGRNAFFFSDCSWRQPNDGPRPSDTDSEKASDWVGILAPEHADYDPRYTMFLVVFGIMSHNSSCSCRLFMFDLPGRSKPVDAVLSSVPAAPSAPAHPLHPEAVEILHGKDGPYAHMIADVCLGQMVSCLYFFSRPPQLNHLVCTRSFLDEDMSFYDWRFGIKVGAMPVKRPGDLSMHQLPVEDDHTDGASLDGFEMQVADLHDIGFPDDLSDADLPDADLPDADFPDATWALPDLADDNVVDLTSRDINLADFMMEDELDVEDFIGDDEPDMLRDRFTGPLGNDMFEQLNHPNLMRMWGLESTMALPPFEYTTALHPTAEHYAECGLRLISMADSRQNKIEITVWDISFLLHIPWRPLDSSDSVDDPLVGQDDLSAVFPWWTRGTPRLRQCARQMMMKNGNHAHVMPLPQNGQGTGNDSDRYSDYERLPYSPPSDESPLILKHCFDANRMEGMSGPAYYIAYNVMQTSLLLLTRQGSMTVMDIETGQVTGTVDNVAAMAAKAGTSEPRVQGVDVQVIGDSEVVVTSRQGIFHGSI